MLLFPSYVLKRVLEPGPRARGLVLAGGSAVAAFCLFTPYALLHARDFREGATTQWSYHYEGAPAGAAFASMVLTYGKVLVEAFGPSLALPVGLLPFLRRRWREWAPVLLYPVVTVLAFSTSPVRHERFLVPALGVVALVCGAGIETLARRHAAAASVLAVVAAVAPLVASLHYIGAVGEPIVRDRVVDWLTTHAPERARILSHDGALGIDRERFDVYLPRNLSLTGGWSETSIYW